MAASMSATRLPHAFLLASCAIALQPTAKLVVVKYGGHCMTDEAGFARDVVALQQRGAVVVVHGGGPQIRTMLRRLGPGATRDVVEVAEMVLGRIGKNLAAAIGAAGGRAVGLSGRDDGMMRMRQSLRVDATLLRALVGMGVIPVVAPLAVGDGTETVKLDADTVAGTLAGALKADALLLLTDVPGVLDEAGELLSELSAKDAERLVADGTITGGMAPKVAAAVDAIENGAKAARIVDGRASWLDARGTEIT
jgi:acetylglutamate kinase